MTTHKQIEEWVNRGIEHKVLTMMVVCNRFTYGDFPVYAKTVSTFDAQFKKYNATDKHSPYKIMEVYNLRDAPEIQLGRTNRTFSFPVGSKYSSNDVVDTTPTKEELFQLFLSERGMVYKNPVQRWLEK
jgi:hypothetical protein